METSTTASPPQGTDTSNAGDNQGQDNGSDDSEYTDSRRARRGHLYAKDDNQEQEWRSTKSRLTGSMGARDDRDESEEDEDSRADNEAARGERKDKGEQRESKRNGEAEGQKNEKPKQTFKVKVDGKDIEVTEDELKRGYSHQQVAARMLQEGREAKRKAESLLNAMKNKETFFEAVTSFGHNPKELFFEYAQANQDDPEIMSHYEKALLSKIKMDMMDPIERENITLKSQLEKQQQLERQHQERVREQQLKIRSSQLAEEYTKGFTEALPKHGLPATKETVARMASYIKLGLKNNYQITPDEAAKLVKDDIQNQSKNVITGMDGDKLLELFGDEVAQKILAARGARVKNPSDQLKTPSRQGERRSRTDKRPATIAEWRRMNRG